jgi:hypothetical protein
MLDTRGYKHTLRICDTYGFFKRETVITRAGLSANDMHTYIHTYIHTLPVLFTVRLSHGLAVQAST